MDFLAVKVNGSDVKPGICVTVNTRSNRYTEDFWMLAADALVVQKEAHVHAYFPKDTALFNLNNCLELSTTELDLVILANIQASTHVIMIELEKNEVSGVRGAILHSSQFRYAKKCFCICMG